jgi:Cys-rich repeat protein
LLVGAWTSWGCEEEVSDAPCVRNSDCAGGNQLCIDGRCEVECAEARDCDAGERCEEGACVSDARLCRTSDDCVFGEECRLGECVKVDGYCERNADCPEGQACRGDLAQCVDVEPSNNNPNNSDPNNANNSDPPECSVDGDCDEGERCRDGACEPECAQDADCGQGRVCDRGRCEEEPEPPECSVDGDCAEGERCRDGSCGPECGQDADCGVGRVCDRGRCEDEPEVDPCGGRCTASEECCEGACVLRGQCGGPPPTCTEQPLLCLESQECCEGECVSRGTCGVEAPNYWDTCARASECSSELCLGAGASGRCTQLCSVREDCPQSPSSLCIQNYHVQGQAGAAGLCYADDTGQSCTSADGCFDGLCIGRLTGQGGVVRQCTIRCERASDCRVGLVELPYGCGPISFDQGNVSNVCTPLGQTCSGANSADQCFTGICLTDDQTNVGYCSTWCVDDGNCPSGWGCLELAPEQFVCVQ